MIIDNSYLVETNPDVLKRVIFSLNQELLALEKLTVQLKERLLVLNYQIAKNVDPDLFKPAEAQQTEKPAEQSFLVEYKQKGEAYNETSIS